MYNGIVNVHEPAESNPNREPVFKISGVMPNGQRSWTYYQGKNEADALEQITVFAGWSKCRVMPIETVSDTLALEAAAGVPCA